MPTYCVEARDFREGTGNISVVVHGDHSHCEHHDRRVGHLGGYPSEAQAAVAAERFARFLDRGTVSICDCAIFAEL